MSSFKQLSRIDPILQTLIIIKDMMAENVNCEPIRKNVFIFFVSSAKSDSYKDPYIT